MEPVTAGHDELIMILKAGAAMKKNQLPGVIVGNPPDKESGAKRRGSEYWSAGRKA